MSSRPKFSPDRDIVNGGNSGELSILPGLFKRRSTRKDRRTLRMAKRSNHSTACHVLRHILKAGRAVYPSLPLAGEVFEWDSSVNTIAAPCVQFDQECIDI